MLQSLGLGSHRRPLLLDSERRGSGLAGPDDVVLHLLRGLLEAFVDEARALDDQRLGQGRADVQGSRREVQRVLVDAHFADKVDELAGVFVGGHLGVGDDDGLVLAEVDAAELGDVPPLVLPHEARAASDDQNTAC